MLKLKLQFFGHLMGRDDSLEKTLMLGKMGEQEEKGVAEDEMVRWQNRLKGQEFEQTPEDSEGQGSLVCYSPWGHKESDTTEWWNNKFLLVLYSLYLALSLTQLLMFNKHLTDEWKNEKS